MSESPRRLLAIMFSDIVGYSRMMGSDEKLALALVEEHNGLLAPLIRAHKGQVLKFIGDAILSSFESASDAVRCALAVQKALAERNGAVGPERRILVRIGIHVGEIAEKDGEIFGDGVNIAARVEPLAEAGGICVTQTVHQVVRAQNDIRMAALGPRKLKNISEPMELYRILPEGAAAPRAANRTLRRAAASAAAAAALALCVWGGAKYARRAGRKPSRGGFVLAVAPFHGIDAESAKEGLVMQALIDQQLDSLFGPDDGVTIIGDKIKSVPRSREEARRLAEKFGATAIITGNVLTLAGETQIQASLTDARTAGSPWQQFSDGATQSQVEGADSLALPKTNASQAANLALLAASHFYGTINPLKALAFLDKIDPPSAESLAAAGYLQLAQRQNDEAEKLFRKSAALDPRFPRAYNGLAVTARLAGRYAEALAQSRKALELKADYAAAYYNLGMTYELQGQLAQAEQQYRAELKLDNGNSMARFRLANLLEKRRLYSDAAAEYKTLVDQSPNPKYVLYDVLLRALALERDGKPADDKAWLVRYLETARKAGASDAMWPMPVLRYFAGEIDETAAAKAADDPDPELAKKMICDWDYYLGMHRLVVEKNPAAARPLFEKAVATGIKNRAEVQRAKDELARLK
ncbi:MAG: tetratricopeptide repeat protein [Elusimicrobiota bacterium]